MTEKSAREPKRWLGLFLPTIMLILIGDYCGGQMWALSQDENGVWKMVILSPAGFSISSFGEDQDGELYVVNYAGVVYHLIAK